MEIPFLHGQGHEEPADEQEDDVVEIGGGNGLSGHDAEDRKQRDGKHCSGRNGNRFSDPPYGHEDGHGSRAGDVDMIRVKIKKQQHQQCQPRTCEQPDELFERHVLVVARVFHGR